MWDSSNVVVQGKCVALNACFRIEKGFKVGGLSIHLKKLVKQIKFKENRRKEMVKIGAEINEIENTNNWENQWN